MKNVIILGASGSVGSQAVEVCDAGGFGISGVSGNRDVDTIERIVRSHGIKRAAMADPAAASALRERLADTGAAVTDDVTSLAGSGADTVLNSIVGVAGLLPTLAAIDAGSCVALANKESLVVGGARVMERATAKGVDILPVDSEHSAVFQCLQGNRAVKKLILTASGGPFFGMTRSELKSVTPAQALRHPNWSMGDKITIDCATLMNKGLELIEASWLFGVGEEQIEIVVHRQSVVHSMVCFEDNAVLAQLGVPDMRLPIQYALTWPARQASLAAPLDFTSIPALTFDACDEETFVPVALCRSACRLGGTYAAALNGANERAVALFLAGRIAFTDIGDILKMVFDRHTNTPDPDIPQLLAADAAARAEAEALAGIGGDR